MEKTSLIVLTVISLLIISIVAPIGINLLSEYDGSYYEYNTIELPDYNQTTYDYSDYAELFYDDSSEPSNITTFDSVIECNDNSQTSKYALETTILPNAANLFFIYNTTSINAYASCRFIFYQDEGEIACRLHLNGNNILFHNGNYIYHSTIEANKDYAINLEFYSNKVNISVGTSKKEFDLAVPFTAITQLSSVLIASNTTNSVATQYTTNLRDFKFYNLINENGTSIDTTTYYDTNIATLVNSIIPISGIIGIVLIFINVKKLQ